MNPLAAKLLVCSAMFIWAASASVGADPDAAEERSVPCDDVPAAVRTAFGKSFPKATVLRCVKEEEMGKSAYELTSTEGETTRDVLLDPDGALLVVEEAIAAAYLPKAVKQTWRKRFANYTIVLVEKVTRRHVVTYEIQSTSVGRFSENVFDGSGKELTGLISPPR
jgi:hypothetical protein